LGLREKKQRKKRKVRQDLMEKGGISPIAPHDWETFFDPLIWCLFEFIF
jgi:hypothetical protein